MESYKRSNDINSFALSLLNPFSYAEPYPDNNVTPYVMKSVTLTQNIAALQSSLLLVSRPAHPDNTRVLELLVPDNQRGGFTHVAWIPAAEDIADNYYSARLVSHALQVAASTVSTTSATLSGTMNVADIQDPIGTRSVSYQAIPSYARNKHDVLTNNKLSEGSISCFRPEGTMAYRILESQATENTDNLLILRQNFPTTTQVAANFNFSQAAGSVLKSWAVTDPNPWLPQDLFGNVTVRLSLSGSNPVAQAWGVQVRLVCINKSVTDWVTDVTVINQTPNLTIATPANQGAMMSFTTNMFIDSPIERVEIVNFVSASPNATSLELTIESTEYYQYSSRAPATYIGISGMPVPTIASAGLVVSLNGMYNYQAVPDSQLARQMATAPNEAESNPAIIPGLMSLIAEGRIRFIYPRDEWKTKTSMVPHTIVPTEGTIAEAAGLGEMISGGLSVILPIVKKALEPFFADKAASASGLYRYRAALLSDPELVKRLEAITVVETTEDAKDVTGGPPPPVLPNFINPSAKPQVDQNLQRLFCWSEPTWLRNCFPILERGGTGHAGFVTMTFEPITDVYTVYRASLPGGEAFFRSGGVEISPDSARLILVSLAGLDTNRMYFTFTSDDPDVALMTGGSMALATFLLAKGIQVDAAVTGGIEGLTLLDPDEVVAKAAWAVDNELTFITPATEQTTKDLLSDRNICYFPSSPMEADGGEYNIYGLEELAHLYVFINFINHSGANKLTPVVVDGNVALSTNAADLDRSKVMSDAGLVKGTGGDFMAYLKLLRNTADPTNTGLVKQYSDLLTMPKVLTSKFANALTGVITRYLAAKDTAGLSPGDIVAPAMDKALADISTTLANNPGTTGTWPARQTWKNSVLAGKYVNILESLRTYIQSKLPKQKQRKQAWAPKYVPRQTRANPNAQQTNAPPLNPPGQTNKVNKTDFPPLTQNTQPPVAQPARGQASTAPPRAAPAQQNTTTTTTTGRVPPVRQARGPPTRPQNQRAPQPRPAPAQQRAGPPPARAPAAPAQQATPSRQAPAPAAPPGAMDQLLALMTTINARLDKLENTRAPQPTPPPARTTQTFPPPLLAPDGGVLGFDEPDQSDYSNWADEGEDGPESEWGSPTQDEDWDSLFIQ